MAELVNLPGNISGGEEVQNLFPKSHVVKCWNSVGHVFMIDPPFPLRPQHPICGNDKASKEVVGKLLDSVGWTPLDLGTIVHSRYLEPLCSFWCNIGMTTGNWANVITIQTLPAQKQ